MGGWGSGGCNKAHRTIENYSRLDSFDYRRFIDLLQDGEMHEIFGPNLYYGGAIMYDGLYDSSDIRFGDRYIPLDVCWVDGVDGSKSRMYFCCPHCKRRVRYLYKYNSFYVCRHCLNANYECQQTTKESMKNIRRQMRKVVEEDLGYTWWKIDNPGTTIDSLGWIPRRRYMRFAKYSRLIKVYRDLQDQYTRLWCKDVWGFMPKDMQEEFSKIL